MVTLFSVWALVIPWTGLPLTSALLLSMVVKLGID